MKCDSLVGKLFLVADDESIIRELLCEHLESLGARVLAAENGQEAWQLLQVNQVDFILSDVHMPGGDGLELLGRLNSAGMKIPLLFLTGFSDFSAEKAQAMGVIATIAKPFKLKDLDDTIARAWKIETS